MRFDLTDLRLFLNVHEAGTITAGADRTHMTLASASERIRAMERHLATPLLVRHRQGVQPTEAGHTLVHHARLVLRQMEQLRGDLGEHGAGLAGHVRVLCNTSALSEHLPAPLAPFLAACPRIAVDLQERTSQQVADAVRDGLCDFGIAADTADLAQLRTTPFTDDPLVLIAPPGHALAARRAVALQDAAGFDFIGLPEDSALQAHLSQQARRVGERLRYCVRLQHFDAIARLVGLGAGIAIVPRAAAARLARTMGVRRIRLTDSWAARRLVLCARNNEPLTAPAQALWHRLAPAADAAPGGQRRPACSKSTA